MKSPFIKILVIGCFYLITASYAMAEWLPDLDFDDQIHSDVCDESNFYCVTPPPCPTGYDCTSHYDSNKKHLVYSNEICPGFDVIARVGSPIVRGNVITTGSNAPVAGVWVEYTDSKGATRYAKTDANGRYTFYTWGNCFNKPQLQVLNSTRIDANLDGVIDDKDPARIFNGETKAFNCSTSPGTIKVFPSERLPAGSCNPLVIYFGNDGYDIDLSDPKGKICARKVENHKPCAPSDLVTTPQYISCKPPKTNSSTNIELNSEETDLQAVDGVGYFCLQTSLCKQQTSSGPTPTSTTPPLAECKIPPSTSSYEKSVHLSGMRRIFKDYVRQTRKDKMWLLECIQEGTDGYTCTSGSNDNDQTLFGKNNFDYLQTTYGFTSQIFNLENNQYVNNPVTEDNLSDLYEWKSATPLAPVDSVFMIGYIQPNSGEVGASSVGALQQATLSFNSPSKTCQLIHDPAGKVFDTYTLEPLSRAKVTLLKKAQNSWQPVSTANSPETIAQSSFRNPQITRNNGAYNFAVADGNYLLETLLSGYSFSKSASKNKEIQAMYPSIYSGEIIKQSGKDIYLDIPMAPISKQKSIKYAQANPVTFTSQFVSLNKKTRIYTIEGFVSHPKANIYIYAGKSDGSLQNEFTDFTFLTSTSADLQGKFKIDVPLSSIPKDEVLAQIRTSLDTLYIDKLPRHSAPDSVTLNAPLDTISGTAFSPDGSILRNSRVQVKQESSAKTFSYALTDSNGHFTLDANQLPGTQYSIDFLQDGNLITRYTVNELLITSKYFSKRAWNLASKIDSLQNK